VSTFLFKHIFPHTTFDSRAHSHSHSLTPPGQLLDEASLPTADCMGASPANSSGALRPPAHAIRLRSHPRPLVYWQCSS
jgi:hypothetical protein